MRESSTNGETAGQCFVTPKWFLHCLFRNMKMFLRSYCCNVTNDAKLNRNVVSPITLDRAVGVNAFRCASPDCNHIQGFKSAVEKLGGKKPRYTHGALKVKKFIEKRNTKYTGERNTKTKIKKSITAPVPSMINNRGNNNTARQWQFGGTVREKKIKFSVLVHRPEFILENSSMLCNVDCRGSRPLSGRVHLPFACVPQTTTVWIKPN